MKTSITLTQSARSLILRSDLRQLKVAADQHAGGDTIHALRNSLATAQGALSLLALRHANGVTDEDQELLDLAERRLQDARALLAQTRQARFANYRHPVACLTPILSSP